MQRFILDWYPFRVWYSTYMGFCEDVIHLVKASCTVSHFLVEKYQTSVQHVSVNRVVMLQEERIKTYKAFKDGSKRILVATDLVGRGIDIERVNIVINYDMPETDDVSQRKHHACGSGVLHKNRHVLPIHCVADKDVTN